MSVTNKTLDDVLIASGRTKTVDSGFSTETLLQM